MGEPLSMDGRHAVDGAALSENAFYRSYKWCLNPVLSLRDLFRHLREEMDRYGSLGVDWQREEARINLWILACAIACTVDDYLVRRPWDFSSIGRRFSRLRVPAAFLEWLLNWPNSLHVILSDRAVRRWRLSWHECMDQVCDLLTSPGEARSQQWADLRAMVQTLTD